MKYVSFIAAALFALPLVASAQAVPGGADTQVQFNNGGAFGGDPNFTWSTSTETLGVSNLSNIDGSNFFYNGVNSMGNSGGVYFNLPNAPFGSNTGAPAFSISGGNGDGAQEGTDITIVTGTSNDSGNGGTVTLNAQGSGPNGGNGGAINIASGNANGSTGDAGHIILQAGTSSGTGLTGYIILGDTAGDQFFVGGTGEGFMSNLPAIRSAGSNANAFFNTGNQTADHILNTPNSDGTLALGTGVIGNCAVWTGTNTLGDTGAPCGAGGGGGGGASAWPWTITTNFGVGVNATTTPEWLQSGVFASSTSRFDSASTTLASIGTLFLGATNAILSTNASGRVVATSTIGNNQLANSAITINTSAPLMGGGAVALGGTLSISCPTCGAGGGGGGLATSSLVAIFPLKLVTTPSSATFSLSFGTTTANTWANVQTFSSGFISNASSTINGNLALSGTLNIGTTTQSATEDLGTNGATILRMTTTGSGSTGRDLFQMFDSSGTSSGWELGDNQNLSGANDFSLASFSGGSRTFLLSIQKATGNVGIATTSPGSVFAIGNVANFSAATSTFYGSGGINVKGGCFSINGVCISGGGGASLSSANTWTQVQTFSSGFIANASSIVNGNLSVSGMGLISGNLLANPAGSSTSSPRVIGFSPTFVSGQAAQIQFGDINNTIQNGWGDRMQLTGYWGLELRGNQRANFAPQFVTGQNSDASVAIFGTSGDGSNILSLNNNAGTALDVVSSTGNLGLGTTTPGSLLSLGGIANFTAATSTFYSSGGVNLKSGCFSINGVCISGGGGASLSSANTWTQVQTFASGFVSNATSTIQGGITASNATVSGKLSVGTTSTKYLVNVGSNAVSGVVAAFENSNGVCTINPTSGSVNCSSDRSLKKDITSIDREGALSGVVSLNPVFYNWNSEATGSPQHSGFIAQEVQQVFPDLVSVSPNNTLLLNYAGFTPYLTAALQELATQVAPLTSATSSARELVGGAVSPTSPSSGAFSSASDTLQSEITALGSSVVHVLQDSVYAATGIFDKVFAKEVHTDKLCVTDSQGETCVTRAQLDALIAAAAASSPTHDR